MVIFLLYKNTLIKIKKSFGRYISLFMIVMVGVGFYAGIGASAPDITKVADSYYKSNNLMDFKIVSSMGLTEDDVNAIKHLGGINDVIPSYSLDVQSRDKTIRIHAIEDKVNTVKLTAGQMPQSDTECVADSKNYKIGDKVEVTSDATNKLQNTEFTVVALAESVLYLSENYGSTTIGDGKLSSFIFVNKNNFILEAYTEIYVTTETNNTIAYSDEYKDLATKLNDELVKIKPDRENARFDEIYSKAKGEIDENETKLNDEKSKAEKEFEDAKKELDDNKSKLKDGKKTGLKEFKNAKATLDENSQKLKDAKKELIENEATLEDTIKSKNAEFESAKQKIADGWKEINSALSEAEMTKDEIGTKITELDVAIVNMKKQFNALPDDSPEYEALGTTITEYSVKLEGLKQLKTSIDTLSTQEKKLNDGIATFNAEMKKAKSKIASGKAEFAANEQKLNDGYKEYNDNLAKFNAEMAENEKKLNEGYAEYNKNLEKFNHKMADAEKKIADAKTELLDIKHPKWYISDRNAAIGYGELDSGIKVITSISAVFPLFFILIVMLMASNSMTRMIAEERSELGTLTSLGYKDRSIIFTYLLYVLSASGLGTVTGFFVGCRIIPPLINSNFMFILPPLVLQYNLITLAIILAVAFTLMIFVTLVTCNKELKQKPASLMRPLPPKHGQKIFLERIGLIWKHLSFTWKITMRNMFRYKKRAFMTIVGVAGCASLLVVAFGLRDSMNGVAQKQYGDILRYSNMIILKDETQLMDGEIKTLLDKEQVTEPLLIKQSAYKCEKNHKSLDAFLIVPQNNEMFEKYYHLRSVIDKKDITLNDGDVVITKMIATLYKLQKGGTIMIKDTDNNIYDLTVADVAENYTSNYIYMNASTYNKVFGSPVTFNTIVSDHNTDDTNLAEHLIDSGLVINVIFTNDVMEKALDNNQSLNGVIILVVVVASLLAIIVLYNLTAINISERTREIATLKVLGFRDGETNAYIYREALILTIVSIGIGMVLGIVLHRFVVDVIESDTTVLFKEIEWFSFILSCILTMVFSVIMQVVTYFKLKKIDMIESLKSVE